MQSRRIPAWPEIAVIVAVVAVPAAAGAHDWSRPGDCGVPDCTPGVDCKESFPLAEGYGSITVGGRCSDVVLVVTDLSDTPLGDPPAEGTLRWAIEHSSHAGLSRTIVFNHEGPGIISLSRPITFQANDSHITIAGETAPGGGIVITNFGFHLLGAHDIIIRHLRFRNIRGFQEVVEPVLVPGTVGDGIEIEGAERIMIDHVSVSWATDEGIGAEGAIDPGQPDDLDITVQNSYISETLWNGDHPDAGVSGRRRRVAAEGAGGRRRHGLLQRRRVRDVSAG